MKISLACKLDREGAYGFIKPLADVKAIDEICVFRDSAGLAGGKIKYFSPKIKRPALLSQFCKLIKMLFTVNRRFALSIGIYEIPHGLFAFIVGKIRRVPVVICVIGNPGYAKVRRGLRKWVMYFMLKRIECVTVTGSRARKILVENGVDPSRIRVLPNAVDFEKFQKKSCDKVYDLIVLGRLSAEKELGNFLEIVSRLKQKYPDISCGIAGKGPEKGFLERKIVELGLEENVKLLGYVDDIVDFYNSGRIFVLTSSTEGLPRTLIEAMGCEVACVASNVGDVEDLIEDGRTGFVVDNYGDVEKYTEKISLLLEDQEIYGSIAENALRFVVEKYSFAAASVFWKEVLADICGENKN